MDNIESYKNDDNTIKNIGDYLADNLDKIDGFQYQWNSLITSNPLLFEDIDYLRVKQYINNKVTKEEIQAYKDGKLTELYATFENMLICNLQYYDRIMSFCTMIFSHYVRISESEIATQSLEDIPFMFELTPTQIWCAALTSSKSTIFELNNGWNYDNKLVLQDIDNDKTVLENNWNALYDIIPFAKFTEYCSVRRGTSGFRATLLADKTSNRKLAQVCAKFTKTSSAISEESLNSLVEYSSEIDIVNNRLYIALHTAMMKLYNNDDRQFAIYVFPKEFYIHTSKFSMKVEKDGVGRITKDYLANSYECFLAEEFLFKTIKNQIEWARYILPIKNDFDKEILHNLLLQMLIDNFKETMCIKRMNDYGTVSVIRFSGIFDKVYVEEDLMYNNKCIKRLRNCMSKENATKYIINRGYYIFGIESDIFELPEVLTKNILIEHYSKYCTPIIQHMSPVIALHTINKNDIIDVLCTGRLNPLKINNRNIKYTDIKSHINPRKLMNSIGSKKKNRGENKNYWQAIEN